MACFFGVKYSLKKTKMLNLQFVLKAVAQGEVIQIVFELMVGMILIEKNHLEDICKPDFKKVG